MSRFCVKNVAIKGIASCVPKYSERIADLLFFDKNEAEKFSESTGIRHRRVADSRTTTSDLCHLAAEKLLSELGWEKSSIDFLVFVTQTPDYILPATSCILQHRLGLSTDTYAIDISLGCSGWVYGLSTLSQMIFASGLKRGLLLVGETALKPISKFDKSAYPIFGDCGTATALEYDENAVSMSFLLNTNGAEYDAIIIPDGGFRSPCQESSLKLRVVENGISRNSMQLILNGMDIFSFAISSIPQNVAQLLDFARVEKEDVDFFLFHQANLYLNETIREKLKLEILKVPYSLKNYGNTSSATIPLTMTTQIREQLQTQKLKLIASGFGVGLSWGSVYFETNEIVCPELIEI